MRTRRTFLAISIPCGTEFPALVDRLKRNLQHEKYINYVKTNQIHLTLKFVGETAEEDVRPIIEACKEVAARHQPFVMDFDRLGIFGSNGTPRVLWLGMNNQPQALFDLEADILDAFDGLGYLRDRQNFVPHLTICRIKSLVDKKFFEQIYHGIDPKTYLHTEVRDLVYFQSFLQPSGPFYKVLAKMPLGTKG